MGIRKARWLCPAPTHVRPGPGGPGRAFGLGLGQGRANIFFCWCRSSAAKKKPRQDFPPGALLTCMPPGLMPVMSSAGKVAIAARLQLASTDQA